MNSETSSPLFSLLAENERVIIGFYRLATLLIVGALILHLAFASFYVYSAALVDNARVLLFAVFNIAVVVEIFLSRMGFMLGSRAGQLRDMQYALKIAESDLDVARLEAAARAIMSMRRDVSSLKILDLENIVAKLSSGKSSGKDAA